MNRITVLMAQVDPKELGGYWQSSNISKAGLGTLIAAISVVTVCILIWAIFIRKPDRDRPRRYDYPRLPNSESNNGNNGSSGHRSRRKKRRRRDHRPRKPTLSETGGLPPVRADVPSDDPP